MVGLVEGLLWWKQMKERPVLCTAKDCRHETTTNQRASKTDAVMNLLMNRGGFEIDLVVGSV